MFDFSDTKQAAGLFGIQHQNDDLFRESFLGKLSPITGGFLTENSAFYFYTGAQAEYDFGLFTITPDWHPIIDQIPGVEGLYCAVGFSGHGFKLAPSVGSAVVDLITGSESENIDIRELRLNRFSEGDIFTSSYKYNVLA